MATRRSFIQVAACTALPVAALPATAGPAPALAPPSLLRRHDLHAVVIDEAQQAALTFGNRLQTRGLALLSVREGDITAPWLAAIRPLWTQRPATLAGLTTPAALFCLEQLAWQHGLRVVFHAEHILLRDGGVEHEVQRDPLMARLTASNLQRAGEHWPARLADAMAARRPAPARRPGPSLAALQPTLPEGAQLLTSWIIAAA